MRGSGATKKGPGEPRWIDPAGFEGMASIMFPEIVIIITATTATTTTATTTTTTTIIITIHHFALPTGLTRFVLS